MCGLFGGGAANMTNQQKADDAMGRGYKASW